MKTINESKKALYAGGVIVLCCAGLVGGLLRRNQVDIGSPNLLVSNYDETSLEGLLASKSRDVQVSEDSFFSEMSSLLKKEFVDPIEDDTKLATGAIRGMVSSLGDANSFYMDADEFKAFRNAEKGELEGIGAEFALRLESPNVKAARATPSEDGPPPPTDQDARSIPVLTVIAVSPDGPAGKAGIKPGDWVESINGHALISPKLIRELRGLQKQATTGKLSSDKIFELNQVFQDKVQNSILPPKAKDKLTLGDSGEITVAFSRGGATFTRKMVKRTASLPTLSEGASGSIALRFHPGATDALREAIAGKTDVTIDLRNSGNGSFEEMKKCLALVAPKGSYGSVTSKRKGVAPRPLLIASGNQRPPKMVLVVDGSTRGAAEMFALALSSKGLATLKGEKMAGAREVIEVVSLPEGSGYTLVTGVYEPMAGGSK